MTGVATRTHPAVENELARARAMLHSAGVETPDLDARLLVAHAFGLPPKGVSSPADHAATDAVIDLDALLARRIRGEPVSRIVGGRGFWTLDLEVTPAVLDPRPDTEAVVEAALHALRAQGRAREPLRVLDLGTGSGAILLALLAELPQARGTGVDVSSDALAVAARNAARHGVADRAAFVLADYSTCAVGLFDLVVANPPYIRSAEIASLPPEVRDHDPREALDGGADGLDAYRAILARLRELLASRGIAILEIGIGQEDEVSRLASLHGVVVSRCHHDLGGVPRALVIHG